MRQMRESDGKAKELAGSGRGVARESVLSRSEARVNKAQSGLRQRVLLQLL